MRMQTKKFICAALTAAMLCSPCAAYAAYNAGENSQATGSGTAVGKGTSANSVAGTAVGEGAQSKGQYSLAVGTNAIADDTLSIAIGVDAQAQGQQSIVIGGVVGDGPKANRTKIGAIAIGTNTYAYAEAAVALGYGSNASANYATALGRGAAASAERAVAVGVLAGASGERAIAIGSPTGSTADTATTATAGDTVAIGSGVKVSGQYSTAIGASANVESASSHVLEDGASAKADNSVALGSSAAASAANSVALGANTTASEENSVAVGNRTIGQLTAHKVGSGTDANYAATTGQLYNVSSRLGLAPDGTTGDPTGNFTIGGKADYPTVQAALTQLDNITVQYADGAQNKLKLADSGSNVKLSNLAKGDVSNEDSTDAVTGGQLYATNQNVAANASAISTLKDSAVVYDSGKTSITLSENGGNGTVIHNVGTPSKDTDAANKKYVDDSITTISGSVGTLNNRAVLYTDDGKTSVELSANSGDGTKLTNVKAGENGLDAVNFKQLSDTNANVTALDGRMDTAESDIGTLGGKVTANETAIGTLQSTALLYTGTNRLTLTDSGTSVKITNVADPVGDSDAVNLGYMKQYVGDEIGKIGGGAGGSFTLTGDGNISVTPSGSDYTIGMSAEPTFDKVNLNNDAAISPSSQEAVRGSQLNSFGEAIAGALGGTSSFTNGALTTGLTVNGKSYNNIQEALTAAAASGSSGGTGTGGGSSSWTLEVNGEAQSVGDGGKVSLADSDSVNITNSNGSYQFNVNKNLTLESLNVAGKVDISSSGIAMGGTDINMGGGRITGLADGGVYQGSSDAVTGNQLWDAYQRIGMLDGELRERINVVGAHAAALSGLHPIQYNPYEPTTLSAAIGTYRDEYAVAVGVFHYVRENLMFNVGASLCSDGDVMGRAGVSLAVGKSTKRKPELARHGGYTEADVRNAGEA